MQVTKIQNNNYTQNFGRFEKFVVVGDLCRDSALNKKLDLEFVLKNNKVIKKYCERKNVDIEIGSLPVKTGDYGTFAQYTWVSITDAYNNITKNPFKKLRNFLKYIKGEGIYIVEENDWGNKLIHTIDSISNEEELSKYYQNHSPAFMKYFLHW